LADDEMDFERNCVFLDEAGFNLHITRNRGWSVKGTSAKIEVPTARGTSITILGAISSQGIIDVSLRKPTTVSGSKKRRADGKVIETTARVGTRTEHFLFYLNNLMDVLDRNNLRGLYIVMDNAPIHKPNKVRECIEKRGYKCVYLPPYSPFLNPIEEFWSKVKFGVKRAPFDTGDTLTPRIMESCSKVTQEDCIGWIKHSVNFFQSCLNLEKKSSTIPAKYISYTISRK
jgi:transposase